MASKDQSGEPAPPARGSRRCLPVENAGRVVPTGGSEDRVVMWTCEEFDGRIWHLQGIAASRQECRAYLAEQP